MEKDSLIITQRDKDNNNNNYYPGKLLVLMNEYFNNQKNLTKNKSSITYWESYVKYFFNNKCKYCIIMNQEGKQWVFNSGYETLPAIFNEKYDNSISLISANMDSPYEYILAPEREGEGNRYLLYITKFSKIEKYQQTFVVTNGILTVLFDQNLKIANYEFQSLSHKEYNNEDNNIIALNDFGITPQFSRTLVISEALTEMVDSINEFVCKFN